MPVIKAEFGFFQVQVKRMSCYAVKLYQTVFCITPKRLDTVDMPRSAGKFILPVTPPEMLCKTHINQAVITTPAIGIDDTPNRNVPALPFAVWLWTHQERFPYRPCHPV